MQYARQSSQYRTDVQHLVDTSRFGSMANLSYFEKCDLIEASPIATCMACWACQKQCQLPQTDVDFSGLPCTPWSPSGSRLGVEDSCVELHIKWCIAPLLRNICKFTCSLNHNMTLSFCTQGVFNKAGVSCMSRNSSTFVGPSDKWCEHQVVKVVGVSSFQIEMSSCTCSLKRACERPSRDMGGCTGANIIA